MLTALLSLCTFPRGIKPLSFQYWAVSLCVLLFSIPRETNIPLTHTVPGEVYDVVWVNGLLGARSHAVPHFTRLGGDR